MSDEEFRQWLAEAQPIDERFLFDTPEQAALAGWAHTPSAHARVADVQRRSDDEVLVIVQLDGTPGFHDRDACVCVRHENGKWQCTGSTGI